MFKRNIPNELQIHGYHSALVLIPHPDDEALGCGGLLALLAQSQCDIHVVLVTDGAGLDHSKKGQASIRQEEFVKSLEILGVCRIPEMWQYPDGKLATQAGLVEAIDSAISKLTPDIVIAPWYNDWHLDHAAIGRAARKICKRRRVECLFFEVWTPLRPTHIIDITECIEIKRCAIKCHATALKYGNFQDALIGLNSYRSLFLPKYNQQPIFAEAYERQMPNIWNWKNIFQRIARLLAYNRFMQK